MDSKDLQLASRIGELIGHFPEEWFDYQDWLRDIISFRSILAQRHPAWQAMIIFRWRLLYFAVYTGTVILVGRILKKLKNFLSEKASFYFTILSDKIAMTTQLLELCRYNYILQRIATLLALVQLTLCTIAAFTGILLAFYYQPTALEANKSLTMIADEVSNGFLILSLHHFAGHSLIVLALVQIVVMFLGRHFLLSWLIAWISGICLTLTAIALSWTAIILNWEQTSFWRFKIELSILASIPLIGSFLRDILLGGDGISSITLQHMYTLHSYILVVFAILLSFTHLAALICQEQNWKPEDKRFRFRQLCSSFSEENSQTIKLLSNSDRE